jgi:hypothetical protein
MTEAKINDGLSYIKFGNWEDVPESRWNNKDFCLAACRFNMRSLAYIGEDVLTNPAFWVKVIDDRVKRLCFAYYKNEDWGETMTLDFVNKVRNGDESDWKTDEEWLKSVEEDVLYYFPQIPDRLKTIKICVNAVRKNEWLIKQVPDGLKEQVQKVIEGA